MKETKKRIAALITKFKNPPPVVALIKLQGVIGSMSFKSGLSIESLNETIEEAFKLSKVKAIALSINSPGGSPVQSELIYKRIRELAAEKNLPVISFVEDVAASGGYWLACSGDEIFASESSIVGSIGVIAAGFGFVDAIKKVGIERRVLTQGANKSILDPFLPIKETDVDIIISAQKDIHESFKNLVRTRRNGKLKAEEDILFSGEFWSGKKAQELGLVDSIGDIYTVLKARYGEKVKIHKVGKDRSWIKRKLGIKGNLVTNIIDYFFEKIETKSILNRFGL